MGDNGSNKEKNKKSKYVSIGITIFVVIAASLVLAFVLNQFDVVKSALNKILEILRPFIYGLFFTFIFAPIFNLLVEVFSKKMNMKLAKFFSGAICLIILVAFIAAIIFMIVPQLIDTIKEIFAGIPTYIESLEKMIADIIPTEIMDENEITTAIEGSINSAIDNFTEDISTNYTSYLASISTGVISFLGIVIDIIIAIIVMMYLLVIKDKMKAQGRMYVYSKYDLAKANQVVEDWRYIKTVFGQFFVGKIIDSIIIGILTYVVLLIFDIPYAVLISTFVGVTNIIPYFGPFIGAIPSAIILLVVSPVKCFEFVVIIFIIQQLDGNVIGPKILKEITGIPSFWVLFSIILFGGLFGVFGMVIAVPLFAVIYRFVSRKVNDKLEKKELETEIDKYVNLDYIDTETGEYVMKDEISYSDKVREKGKDLLNKKDKDKDKNTK